MSKGKTTKGPNPKIVFSIIILLGIALLSYPTFSDFWNNAHSSSVISDYTTTVLNLKEEEYFRVWDDAISYNHNLFLRGGLEWPASVEDQEAYDTTLNIDGSGNMGYITIPKIGINLPIYHGVGENVMQNSVGHLMGTSFPVGNALTDDLIGTGTFGSNCVLSSHTGHPSAKLFTDLDQMVIGDVFYLTVLDKVLTYEIDKIDVVLPDNLSLFVIPFEEDYCTLVTCTPYGINSHRLIVRGHRVPNAKGRPVITLTSDALKMDLTRYLPILIVPVLLLFLIFIVTAPSGKKASRH